MLRKENNHACICCTLKTAGSVEIFGLWCLGKSNNSCLVGSVEIFGLWCLGKSNNSCLVGPQVTVCRVTLQRLAVNMKRAALDQIRGVPLTRPSMWDPPLPMFQ